MSDEIKVQSKNKKTKLIIAIATVVIVVLTIVAIVLVSSSGATAKKVKEQLSLGEKYLSELQYEQAIAAYELAIEIDPKSADAYLGLAEVYEEMGDFDKAAEVLEKAKVAVGDEDSLERIEEKLKEIETKKLEALKPIATVTTAPSPTPSPTTTPQPTPTNIPTVVGDFTVGNKVLFGSYEQDNDLSNGKEEIEWFVLEVRDDKALLLSEYALDCIPYDDDKGAVVWKDWDLREWLGHTFYNMAFSDSEKECIADTVVESQSNMELNEIGGEDTIDRVFLMSRGEVEQYLPEGHSKRSVKPTKYAFEQGAWAWHDEESDGNCYWWTRSIGSVGSVNDGELYNAFYVDLYGELRCGGVFVDDYFYGRGYTAVRPAIWVNISKY